MSAERSGMTITGFTMTPTFGRRVVVTVTKGTLSTDVTLPGDNPFVERVLSEVLAISTLHRHEVKRIEGGVRGPRHWMRIQGVTGVELNLTPRAPVLPEPHELTEAAGRADVVTRHA